MRSQTAAIGRTSYKTFRTDLLVLKFSDSLLERVYSSHVSDDLRDREDDIICVSGGRTAALHLPAVEFQSTSTATWQSA